MNTEKLGVYTYKQNDEEKDYQFTFKTDLTAREKISFIDTAVNNLYSGGLYLGVIKNVIIGSIIIKFFTDVDLSHYEGEFNDIEKFINDTNIIEIVKANAKDGLFDELERQISINLKIVTGVNVNDIGFELNGFLKNVLNIVNVNDYSTLVDFAKKVNSMKDSITPDTIVNAYANTVLNPITK